MFFEYLFSWLMSIIMMVACGAAYLIICCVADASTKVCMKVFPVMAAAFLVTCIAMSVSNGLGVGFALIASFINVLAVTFLWLYITVKTA